MINIITGVIKTAKTFSFIRIVVLVYIINILLNLTAFGQNLREEKISLNAESMPLGDVLKTLEMKTSFTFSYLNKEMPLKERVNLDVKDESLQNILEMLSGKFALSFTRINNLIAVKKQAGRIELDKGESVSGGPGTLRGVVRDSLTSEVLPNANVYIKGINAGARTDSRGFFIIPSIPSNKEYTLIVTFVGYQAKKINISVAEKKITDINIYLSEIAFEKENILVTGERESGVDVTVQKISIKELENMSFGVETDIMRAIQLQPGVQSAGDVSARYYVRGGASNENLVLLNGTPIYNPFHALGIFSVIDPDMINGVEFYKGGFGPKYSGRLSSVMDIITKNGNMNKFGVSAAISQLTTKAALEGPIPYGSFMITGRKSISNDILKKFTNNKSVPIDFYDASFKVHYSNPDFLPISKLTFFGFTSKDQIKYQDKLHADYNWSNSHLGFNWFTAAKNSPAFEEFTFYYSKFSGGEIPNSNTSKHIENKVDDFTFKDDASYIFSNKNEIYGGVKVNYVKTKLYLSNPDGGMKDVGSEGTYVGGYLGFKLLSLENLKVDLGSHFNLFNFTISEPYFCEPRVNISYNLLPTLNLKAAWGIYQQQFATISDEDEILALFEPWIVIPEYLKIPNSVHYIAGLEYYMTEKLKVDIEGYYKVMHNLAVVNDEIIFPSDPQLINGSGKSHGAEITVNYKNKRINAQLSYDYAWTIKKIRNIEYHPRYDSRNNVKVFINYDLGSKWEANISWNYSSGMPFTQIYGYYSKYNPSDVTVPSSILTDYAFSPILAGRNAACLPDYHRLDFSLSKNFHLWQMNMYFDFSVLNVYDRKNFFYFDMKTGERVNMLPFLPTIGIKAEL